ncbi:Sec-independent protein translocase protein TatC [Ktedonobacter sp. SOSP1-52]|uniref:twin-arginine translocase subunit TatC n=1 Tax=Ktedonobacter sp. SOSP1-52 TaxID=2778366 RepID=UPI00191521BD|nr:twin-arginine translocase subunit TatC [Ktedonobacter sp. SOSP1-52]GHO66159.1 Sec-independent protein translocase protein TatC [Ktedonobacter sp. SOSP1-52]
MATSNLDQQERKLSTYVSEDTEDVDDELAESAMTLIEHLEELRKRIFKSLISVVIFSVIAFIFRVQIIHFLSAPLPKASDVLGGGRIAVTGIAEGFTVTLLISLAVGILLSIPVLLYQTWAFIAPGLYKHEKKHAVPFILIGIVLFVAGISLGYVTIRYPLEFLVQFSSDMFTEIVTADSYFTFITYFMLAFGIVFEIPLVLTFLALVGIVDSNMLKKRRSTAHVGMWIASCFITPGADVYSPIILGITMSCLYELSIVFIRVFAKK